MPKSKTKKDRASEALKRRIRNTTKWVALTLVEWLAFWLVMIVGLITHFALSFPSWGLYDSALSLLGVAGLVMFVTVIVKLILLLRQGAINFGNGEYDSGINLVFKIIVEAINLIVGGVVWIFRKSQGQDTSTPSDPTSGWFQRGVDGLMDPTKKGLELRQGVLKFRDRFTGMADLEDHTD